MTAGFCVFLVFVVILSAKTGPQNTFTGNAPTDGRQTAASTKETAVFKAASEETTFSNFLYSFGGPLSGAQKEHILSFDALKKDLMIRALSDKAAADKERQKKLQRENRPGKHDKFGDHDKDGKTAQNPDRESDNSPGNKQGDKDTAGAPPDKNNGETAVVKETDITAFESADPTTVEAAKANGFLILANKTHPLAQDYKPEDLRSIKYYAKDRSASGRYMRAEATEKFHKMIEAAKADGLTIVMTTAYRSYSFQKSLWDGYVANAGEAAATRYSARPGQSEHQTGLAVDVSAPSVNYSLTQDFENTKEGKWLAQNAHLFGFIMRYPKDKESITGYEFEPWHFRYVGEAAAAEIYQKGETLEEYLSADK